MSTDYSKDPDFQYLAVDRKKLLAEQKEPYDGKKACWVPDEKEGFARADIVSTKGEEVTVKVLSSQEVRISKIMLTRPCNLHPLTPQFYIIGVYRDIHIFLFLLLNLDRR